MTGARPVGQKQVHRTVADDAIGLTHRRATERLGTSLATDAVEDAA